MFLFFPENYMWSQALNRCLFSGGAFGEISKAAGALTESAESYDNDHWFEVLYGFGDQLHTRANDQLVAGHRISARESNLRGASYYQWSIAFMEHDDPRRDEAYARSIETFGAFASLATPAIERVEVPYEDTSFPAWFVPAAGSGDTPPGIVYLPGWDSTKEQGIMFALAIRERGFSTLLCDSPGVGESVAYRGLVNRHDYEVPAGAAFDYLESRPDVDSNRIATVGLSLGGYRVARTVAFDKRFAAAVAWGAIWDFQKTWSGFRDNPRGNVPTPTAHALAVMGAETLDEVWEKLADWNLEGVAHNIECPFLILHGEHDALVPTEDAQRMFDEAGSSNKELRVFTAAEGGSAHCQNDNRILAHDYISDWLSDLLIPDSR
ncbi:MAG TPA: alpha/beta hydrolase [Acidimicrobiia bacterium]|nr:alpha/beta hydrolase [Acidimicrobiia bacterium]